MDDSGNTVRLDQGSLYSLAGCPDRYEIKGLIGQGGMGMVFRAFDRELQRDVAIKIMLYEDAHNWESQERFLREAQALAVLNDNPNIVSIYSSGVNSNGNPYHVMEMLEGRSLSDELNEGPLNAERFFDLFSQILQALEFAHKQKIVHRDLKPTNIMHCHDAEGRDLYKLIDFGIARIEANSEASGNTLTSTNSILGSPIYISPEQCRASKVDSRSDLYSLGCIMYECISGKPPFCGESAFETMYKHMSETPVALDGATKSARSKQLALLIHGCLQKKPEERPQSASEVAAELNQIFADDFDIDLFVKQRKQVKINVLALASLVLALISASAVTAALFVSMRNGSANQEFLQKTSEQGKVDTQIERVKARLASWKSTSAGGAISAQREHYLDDVFALCRIELKSSKEQDLIDAGNLCTASLKLCRGDSVASRRRVAACYVLRGKSEWKRGLFEASDADFTRAIQAVTDGGQRDSEAFIDIMLERTLLRIHSARYADGMSDYMYVVRDFEKDTGKNSFLDITQRLSRFNQTLDRLGDDRCKMTNNMAVELRTMKPRSEAEAVDMLILSNRLTLSLTRIAQMTDARLQYEFSCSLLPRIKGHDELKKATADLSTEVNKGKVQYR